MSLNLEELRKRLLHPPSVDPAPHVSLKPGRQFPSALPVSVQQLTDEDASQKNTLAGEEHSSVSSSTEVVSPIEPMVLEKNDREVAASAGTNTEAPANQLTQAIDKLFEPAHRCQQRLSEITESCEVINQLARSTLELCQPLQDFGDRLRKLSKAFFSLRTFRNELSIIAECFEPIGILNKQIVQLEDAVQSKLTEVAIALKSTEALRTRIAELERSVDSVSKLETQFLELSRCFGTNIVSS
jgi:DNA repair exonuclease SbcCD ATPase subunit